MPRIDLARLDEHPVGTPILVWATNTANASRSRLVSGLLHCPGVVRRAAHLKLSLHGVQPRHRQLLVYGYVQKRNPPAGIRLTVVGEDFFTDLELVVGIPAVTSEHLAVQRNALCLHHGIGYGVAFETSNTNSTGGDVLAASFVPPVGADDVQVSALVVLLFGDGDPADRTQLLGGLALGVQG